MLLNVNKMKISEISAGQGNVEVEGVVKEIGETRSFNKFGRELKVANAILEDDSGSIKLTLWNDDVARFNNGDKIKVINGYVNEFQGEKQLTSGKYGSIEKVEGGEAPAEETPSEAPTEETPSEAPAEEESPSPSEEPEKIEESVL